MDGRHQQPRLAERRLVGYETAARRGVLMQLARRWLHELDRRLGRPGRLRPQGHQLVLLRVLPLHPRREQRLHRPAVQRPGSPGFPVRPGVADGYQLRYPRHVEELLQHRRGLDGEPSDRHGAAPRLRQRAQLRRRDGAGVVRLLQDQHAMERRKHHAGLRRDGQPASHDCPPDDEYVLVSLAEPQGRQANRMQLKIPSRPG